MKGVIPIIAIDLRSSKPIYEQIRDNIKRLIITGALNQDEKLPSIRELAQITSINPNTIQKAYRELENEGLIYTVAGRGNFVSPPPKKQDQVRVNELYGLLTNIIEELIYLGIPERDIIKVIHDTTRKKEEKHDRNQES
jgi:GntR family transcriptional regulator